MNACSWHKARFPTSPWSGGSADSLTFSVAGGIHPAGYNGSDQPGFRYDLATDFRGHAAAGGGRSGIG